MRRSNKWTTTLGAPLWTLLLVVVGYATPVQAQNYEILDQRLDTSRNGYTVLRVWGSHYEMGFGLGSALAEDIDSGVSEVRAYTGSDYASLRDLAASSLWLPLEVEEEINGIVAGVQTELPGASIDVLDIKVANAASDWLYLGGCRSHACWGSRVQSPTLSLATRRLDLSTYLEQLLHHVLCAWDPDDGSARWVNLSWPAIVNVITAVNAHGTLVSLHDFNSDVTQAPGLITRSGAARYVLTAMASQSVADHLTWAEQELADLDLLTGTFINYYAPEGLGGVFTCVSGGPCGAARTPQSDYFDGEVLITTNTQTAGHTVPAGGEFMHDYYVEPGTKSLSDHFDLMGTDGLHLLSVDYRGEEDMTLRFHGRGRSDFIEIEWAYLFGDTQPDGGVPLPDGGTGPDAATPSDGGDPGVDAGLPGPGDENAGCGCATADGTPPIPLWFAVVMVMVFGFVRRRRR